MQTLNNYSQMPQRLLTNDTFAIGTLCTSFIANLLNSLGAINLDKWFTLGTFVVALIVGLLKARTLHLEGKIKNLTLKKMQEENAKNDKQNK